MFMRMHQSAFLSKFMLDRSVTATGYKGIDRTRGPGGGIGGSTGGIGPGGRDVRSSFTSTDGFSIIEQGENKFSEGEFIEALAAQIKKEIEENRASITGSGNPTPSEFYFDYQDGDIKGRITVSGAAQGRVYSLKANVDEGNKP